MARSSTTFQKGQIGNPKGRPRKLEGLREAAQMFGLPGIKRLAALGGLLPGVPGDESGAVQLGAIRELLDRGYGKPVQSLSTEGVSGPMVLRVTWAPALPGEDDEPATPLIEHEADG